MMGMTSRSKRESTVITDKLIDPGSRPVNAGSMGKFLKTIWDMLQRGVYSAKTNGQRKQKREQRTSRE